MKEIEFEKRFAPVPTPKETRFTDGEPFALGGEIAAAPELCGAASAFAGYLSGIFGVKAELTGEKAGADVVFELDASLGEEEYRVSSGNGRVIISASSPAGASHGASIILQTAWSSSSGPRLGCFELHDAPDAGWRGLMVDLARGHYPFDELLRYVDLCCYYRLNALHLHFADNGPYKLPSARFPKLSDGSYSRGDIKTLCEYAKNRGITLLPEIEMPSHASALTNSYPEVFGSRHGGMICPGKDGVFEALGALIGEVCDMFPDSPYIHIGCDEAPHREWAACPECSAFMKREGIPSTGALYAYTVGRCAELTLSRGRTPVVWEGFPREGDRYIPRETVVAVFQSTYQDASVLASEGYRVINASWQPLYVVPSRPKYWAPDDIYRWKYNRWLLEDAKDDSGAIDVGELSKVMGAELCLWEGTTYEPDAAVVERNLAAVSERTWNAEYRRSYADFAESFRAASERFKAMRHN